MATPLTHWKNLIKRLYKDELISSFRISAEKGQLQQRISSKCHWIGNLLFAAALLFALLLYTRHLTSDLYGDERGHTYNVVATGNFWSNLKNPGMCHPPLYFLLAKVSYEVIREPWAIRIPSLLFSLGTVALVAFSASRILGQKYFLLSAWLAALSPFLLEFSAEGRAYAMLIFFSVATLWAFYEFLDKENTVTTLFLSGASICGALTHYFFWFQLIFMAFFYLAVRRKITRYAVGVFIITAIVLTPFAAVLLFVQKGTFSNYLQTEFSAAYFSTLNFLGRLYVAINYGYSTFTLSNLDPARNVPYASVIRDNWISIILSAISFCGLLIACIRLSKERTSLFCLFAFGILIPTVVGIMFAKAGFYLIREKHLSIIWGSYFLLLVLAVDYLKGKKWGLAVLVSYMMVVCLSIYHYTFLPNEYTRKMDWTGMNRALQQEVTESDAVLYFLHDPRSLSLGKMSVMEGKSRLIKLETARQNGMPLSDFAEKIERSTQGTVFLINDETDRYAVDPHNEVIRTLMTNRIATEKRFGRNLILYTFRHVAS